MNLNWDETKLYFKELKRVDYQRLFTLMLGIPVLHQGDDPHLVDPAVNLEVERTSSADQIESE